MFLIPYIISITTGYLVIALLFKHTRDYITWLHLVLSVGLGLGLNGLLTFISILIVGKLQAPFVISLNLIFLAVLFLANRSILKDIILKYKDTTLGLKTFAMIIYWALFITGLSLFAAKYPWGGWDAWALWNTKTKFLVFAGANWTDILNTLNWHTQPDYPLLLPSINSWIHTLAKTPLLSTTFITAMLLSSTIIMLLFISLRRFINTKIAFLTSLLMGTNYFFILLSTAQYADVLLALYILASVVTLYLAFESPSLKKFILPGLFLGLMTFTKNEGIVTSILLLSISCIYLLITTSHKKQALKWCLTLSGSYFLCAWVTIYFKLVLTQSNPDILPMNGNAEYTFLNMHGLSITWSHLLKEWLRIQWGYIWFLLIVMTTIKLPSYFKKENLVPSLFLILYTGILLLIYLTTINFDLSWRLTHTLKRILFYLLPTIIFLNCYTHWHIQLPKN
ncbi:MAG: hypothetical protein ACI9F2_000060 [Lysobacterales bacterium]|jgi:hypothetical protein